jgi:hypothetical protein
MFRGICLVTAVVWAVEDGGTVLARDLTHLWKIADVIRILSGIVLLAQGRGTGQHLPYIRKQSLEIRLGNALRPMR